MRATIMVKLLIVMLAVSIIPLGTLGYLALQDARDIGMSAANTTKELGKENLQATKELGEMAVNDTVDALNNHTIKAIDLRTYELGERVGDFLEQREDEVLYAADLTRDAEAYKKFLEPKKRGVWEESDTTECVEGIPKDELTERPIYKKMVYYDTEGQEQLKVSYNENTGEFERSENLKDISVPSNTKYKQEEYYYKAQDLRDGEIWLSDVKGWAIKVSEAYLGQDRPDGKKYEGIYRWITPIYEDGEKTGYVMLEMDQVHLEEFTDHVNAHCRYKHGNPASTGTYGYIQAPDSWVMHHPKDYYKKGYLPNGSLAEGMGGPPSPELADVKSREGIIKHSDDFIHPSDEEKKRQGEHLKEQKEKGYLPLFGIWLSFATGPGYPELCVMGAKGEHGHNIYTWEGTTKYVAMSSVRYGDDYGDNVVNRPHFGWVAIGASLKHFHKPAMETKEVIYERTQQQGQAINQSVAATEETIKERTMGMDTQNTIFVITGVTILIVVLVSILFSRALTKPITSLRDVAERVTKGDFDAKMPSVRSKDEIRDLTAAMEMLVTGFKNMKAKVENLNNKMQSGEQQQDDTVQSGERQQEGL